MSLSNEQGAARLERAIRICSDGGCTTGNVEDAQLALGKHLYASGRDRARGRKLLVTARDGYIKIGRAEDAKDVNQWLQAHTKGH